MYEMQMGMGECIGKEGRNKESFERQREGLPNQNLFDSTQKWPNTKGKDPFSRISAQKPNFLPKALKEC